MNRTHGFGIFVIGFVCIVGLIGCEQRPAVPTIAPEPTQPVIVIIVTATSQPTLPSTNTPEPTITPIPTLTPVAAQVVTVTATTVAQVTRPPATSAVVQPTVAPPSPPPTVAAPTSFQAPVAIAPEGVAFRDGPTIKFEFTSVGPLAADQCYRVDVTLGHPTGPGGVGDYWVGLCGNQSSPGDRLVFELKSGRFRDEANYGTMIISAEEIIPPTPEYVLKWFVSVVRVVDATDPIHPKVEALSPNSGTLQNSFFR